MQPPDATVDPDAALVARARLGDRKAMHELYQLHERRVYNLALRMTGNPWDAADATQEAFIKAFTGLESFRGNARFSTWIHRITVNVVYDHLRRRRPDPLDEETMDRLASTPSDQSPGRSGTLQGIEPILDGLSDEVTSALLSLEESFRLTVVLCDLLGFSYGEAAEILEVQEGTVKSRLFRARALLGKQLASRRGPQPSPDPGTARNPKDAPDVPSTKTAKETG